MNILENIKTSIQLLEENNQYFDILTQLQSKTDKKIDYWLHYIELENIPVTKSYKILREIKKLRQERRKYKNEWELLKVFKDNEQKMVNEKNRQILLTQICKTDNKQQNAKYSYDAYTEEEKEKILGGTK